MAPILFHNGKSLICTLNSGMNAKPPTRSDPRSTETSESVTRSRWQVENFEALCYQSACDATFRPGGIAKKKCLLNGLRDSTGANWAHHPRNRCEYRFESMNTS